MQLLVPVHMFKTKKFNVLIFVEIHICIQICTELLTERQISTSPVTSLLFYFQDDNISLMLCMPVAFYFIIFKILLTEISK